MPDYTEMIEYVLDAGRECECCIQRDRCRGIVVLSNTTLFPACSYKDFNELLDQQLVEGIYKEANAND